jgi:hypothetical protein
MPLRIIVLMVTALFAAACSIGATASTAPSGPAGSPLAAGTHASKVFKPALTFTVPDGWESPNETAGYLQLRPLGDEVVGIHVFKDPVAMSQAPTCPLEAEPGVGPTSVALVKWIRDRPGLVVSQPGLATVGGLQGTVIDVGIVDGWKDSCPFATGLPTVPLIFQPPNGYRWVIAGDERLRLYLLDVPGGGLVIVDIDAFDGTRFDELLAAAAPIVRTFSFATP